jgi:hypothetical protein
LLFTFGGVVVVASAMIRVLVLSLLLGCLT